MLALKFIIGTLVLAGIGYGLRNPPKGFWRGAMSFAVAFALTATVIRVMANQGGIVREDAYARIAANALDEIETSNLPYILFVGASYSRNALDDQALATGLRSRGYVYQVVNFALEGSSLQERDLRLRQLLAAVSRPPEMVFFEISRKFDENPTYGFEVAKFSNRVFGQFDLRGTIWAVRGLLEQRQQLGAKTFLKDSVLLALHIPVNLGNIGLFAHGNQLSEFAGIAAYDPQDHPRSEVTEQARNVGLLAPYASAREPAPNWAKAFRAEQATYLRRAGISKIGYYFPPVIDAGERSYVAARCLEVENCIAPTDLTLLGQLDDDLWFDAEHLLADGAAIYTDWLADRIEQTGTLHNAKRQLALELRR